MDQQVGREERVATEETSPSPHLRRFDAFQWFFTVKKPTSLEKCECKICATPYMSASEALQRRSGITGIHSSVSCMRS